MEVLFPTEILDICMICTRALHTYMYPLKYILINIRLFRFPLKNQPLLEAWEKTCSRTK